MKKSINGITFFNILSTVILQGISLFTAPLFSRLLGAENYGIVSIYHTWVSVTAVVFGLQTQSTLAVSRNEYRDGEQMRYQSAVFALSVSAYFLFTLALTAAVGPLSRLLGMDKPLCLIMPVQGFGLFCSQFLNMKFTYEFRADRNFILSLVITVSSVLLSVLFISRMTPGKSYMGRIGGEAAVYLCIAAFTCFYIFGKGKTFYKKEYWKFCLPLAVPIVFHNLSGLALNQSDRVMLQNMTTNRVVGIYSLAFSFANVLSVIWNALNNSWAPFYYDYTGRGELEELKEHAGNYMELFTVLCAGFMLLAPEVFHLFAGPAYWDGTRLIPLFAMGVYFVFLYSFPVNFEFYSKKTDVIAKGTIAAALCNIVLNLAMIKRAGMFGAAAATAAAHGFQFVFHHICAAFWVNRGKYPFGVSFYMKGLLPFLLVWSFCMAAGGGLGILRWASGALLGIFELGRIFRRRSVF